MGLGARIAGARGRVRFFQKPAPGIAAEGAGPIRGVRALVLGSRASVVPAKVGSAGIVRELMLGSCMGRPALAASSSAPLAEGS